MDRREQHERDRESQRPTERREDRGEQVVERKHVLAQDVQAVEVGRPLVMFDRRDRSEQTRDVCFERDRHVIAKAPVDAREHDESAGVR